MKIFIKYFLILNFLIITLTTLKANGTSIVFGDLEFLNNRSPQSLTRSGAQQSDLSKRPELKKEQFDNLPGV
jgi:hypothetical protein